MLKAKKPTRAREEVQVPSIGDLPSLHQGRQKDELEKPHPSPLAYDPNWMMSETDTGATASARHGRSIRLPRAMLKENSKAEAG